MYSKIFWTQSPISFNKYFIYYLFIYLFLCPSRTAHLGIHHSKHRPPVKKSDHIRPIYLKHLHIAACHWHHNCANIIARSLRSMCLNLAQQEHGHMYLSGTWVMSGLKNRHQKDTCSKKNRITCSKYANRSRFNSQCDLGKLYNHLTSTRTPLLQWIRYSCELFQNYETIECKHKLELLVILY